MSPRPTGHSGGPQGLRDVEREVGRTRMPKDGGDRVVDENEGRRGWNRGFGCRSTE